MPIMTLTCYSIRYYVWCWYILVYSGLYL